MFIMFIAFAIPAVYYGIRDIMPDIKSRNWKTAVAYLALVTCALVLWICIMRNVPLKSQSDIVTSIIRSIFPPLD
jgi:hypothetical protein